MRGSMVTTCFTWLISHVRTSCSRGFRSDDEPPGGIVGASVDKGLGCTTLLLIQRSSEGASDLPRLASPEAPSKSLPIFSTSPPSYRRGCDRRFHFSSNGPSVYRVPRFCVCRI